MKISYNIEYFLFQLQKSTLSGDIRRGERGLLQPDLLYRLVHVLSGTTDRWLSPLRQRDWRVHDDQQRYLPECVALKLVRNEDDAATGLDEGYLLLPHSAESHNLHQPTRLYQCSSLRDKRCRSLTFNVAKTFSFSIYNLFHCFNGDFLKTSFFL